MFRVFGFVMRRDRLDVAFCVARRAALWFFGLVFAPLFFRIHQPVDQRRHALRLLGGELAQRAIRRKPHLDRLVFRVITHVCNITPVQRDCQVPFRLPCD